jgi:hypothetical protein
MASVPVSSVLNAPIAEVWKVVRRFDAVAGLLPFVKSSPIEQGLAPTAVGAVRIVTEADDAVFREVLLAHSDAEHFYSYTFIDSPIPVREHCTTLRFRPITDGDRTLGEWSSRFEIATEGEAELIGLIERNFLAGLRALDLRFGRGAPSTTTS